MDTILAILVLICSVIMIAIIIKGATIKGFGNLDNDIQNLSIGAMLLLLILAPALAFSVIVR